MDHWKFFGGSGVFCNGSLMAETTKRLFHGVSTMTAAILLSLTAPTAHAKVIYVSASQTTNAPPDGMSWTNAITGLQQGIDAASDSDEVWIAGGTYRPNMAIPNFTMKEGVSVYGGFGGSETSLNQRDWTNNPTIIAAKTGILANVITFPPGITTRTRLDGFTIRDGHLDHHLSAGGGILCADSSPVIANNVILLNQAPKGGGIYCSNSFAVITNNMIVSNRANFAGGAICSVDSKPIIAFNDISQNMAGRSVQSFGTFGYGGGIYCTNTPPGTTNAVSVNDNTFSRNVAEAGGGIAFAGADSGIILSGIVSNNVFSGNMAQLGGGVECDNSSLVIVRNQFLQNAVTNGFGGGAIGLFAARNAVMPLIANNFFLSNTVAVPVSHGGGGILCFGSTSPVIANNTLVANRAPAGGGIYDSDHRARVANNVVVFGNSGVNGVPSAGLFHNCVYGNTANYQAVPDPTGINGNISVDPRLASPNDFHLSTNSPCINAGDDSAAQTGWRDLDEQARIAGLHVDIGADEFGSAMPFQLVLLPAPSGGETRIRLTGEPNRTYVLEASPDLANWIAFSTNQSPQAELEVADPEPASGRRFYRAVASPP